MKKTVILLLMLVMIFSSTTSFAASYAEITGYGAFAILDRSYVDQEDDMLIYYHSGCSQSTKMMPIVKKYAQDNNLMLYIADYRKSAFPGAGSYFGSSLVKFPVVFAYNHGINTIGGINGIKSEKEFTDFADEFYALENPEIKITIGSNKMTCNGKTVKLDVPAKIINNRTMVPLRAIMEAYGFTVEWDGKTNEITAKKYSTKISMRTNSDRILVGNMLFWLNAWTQVVDGRTLVPVRGFAEALGADVKWDGATRTVTIK